MLRVCYGGRKDIDTLFILKLVATDPLKEVKKFITGFETKAESSSTNNIVQCPAL